MRPLGVLHLYRVRLRARLAQELLAVAGIAVGVALVFATLVANTSLTGSFRELVDGLVGSARIEVAPRGPRGIDERLVRAVRRTDGVVAAAAAVETQVNVIGPDGTRSALLVGGDAQSARLSDALIHRFAAAAETAHVRALAVPSPIAETLGVTLGDTVRMQIGDRTTRVPVGLTLDRSDIGTLVDNPVVFAPFRFVQQQSEMRGRVTRIDVEPAAGRDAQVAAALRRLVGDEGNVQRADFSVVIFDRAAYPTTRSTAVFCLFSALIGFLFAFSAVLLTVPQRRRFIADLRMAGHQPWVIAQLLLFDALMLGAAGSLLGLIAGDLVSRHLFATVPGFLTYAFVVGEQRIVTWQSVLIAGGAGLAASCVAVLGPLREALARPHTGGQARRDRDGTVRGLAAGCAAIVLATAILVLAPAAGIVAIVALTAALLLLLPALLRGSALAFEALTRPLRSPVPTLATFELRSSANRVRALALAATGAMAVFATVTVGGSHADLQRGLDASARGLDGNGDVWVSFPGAANSFATTAFPVSTASLRALRRVPGVEHVGIYRGSFLDVGDHRTWIQAPPRSAPAPIAPSQIRQGSYSVATRRLREGGWVVLSTRIAKRLGAGIGDRVTLPSPVATPLRVAAISTNLGWPPGAAVLDAADYARAWGSSVPSALQIQVAAGAVPAQVAAAVRRALPPTLPALVETQETRIARHVAASREGLHRLSQVSMLVLISAMLAMAGAMGGMIWQRRPALAALKVHGYPEGELWRALLLESALLLATGCTIGAAFGLYGQVVVTRTLEAITDFPVIYSPAALTALGILLLVTAVAVAMIALPGWLAVRVRPTPGGMAPGGST